MQERQRLTPYNMYPMEPIIVPLKPKVPEPEKAVVSEPPKPRSKSAALIYIGAVLTCTILIYAGHAVYGRFRMISNDTPAEVVAAVGKLVLLPEDEIPTVSTVVRLDNLSNQDFFKNA